MTAAIRATDEILWRTSGSPTRWSQAALVALPYIQPVLAHFLVERCAVDIQLRGGRLAVPGVALQGGLDDLPLGAFQGDVKGHRLVEDFGDAHAPLDRRGCDERLHRLGQVFHADVRPAT